MKSLEYIKSIEGIVRGKFRIIGLPFTKLTKDLRRQNVMFQCECVLCGKKHNRGLQTLIEHAYIGRCECFKGTTKAKYKREYKIWLYLRNRKRNASLGPNISDAWYDNFYAFIEDVGPIPGGDDEIIWGVLKIENDFNKDNFKWTPRTDDRILVSGPGKLRTKTLTKMSSNSIETLENTQAIAAMDMFNRLKGRRNETV